MVFLIQCAASKAEFFLRGIKWSYPAASLSFTQSMPFSRLPESLQQLDAVVKVFHLFREGLWVSTTASFQVIKE